jgi:O-antigen/teichoic acid export membrane protein
MALPLSLIVLAWPLMKPLTHRPSKSWSKSLAAYGWWTSLSGATSPLIFNLDRFMISSKLGSSEVAFYNIVYNLVMKVQILPGSLSSVLLPRMSQHDAGDRRMLAEKSLFVLAGLLAPALASLALLIEPFLHLWLRRDIPSDILSVSQILLVGIWFNALAVIPYISLQSEGKPSVIARIHLLEIAPFVACLWLAITYLGLTGAALAWTLRAIADSLALFYAAASTRMIAIKLAPPLLVILAAIIATFWLQPSFLIRIPCATCVAVLLLAWSWRSAPIELKHSSDRILRMLTDRLRTRPSN